MDNYLFIFTSPEQYKRFCKLVQVSEYLIFLLMIIRNIDKLPI